MQVLPLQPYVNSLAPEFAPKVARYLERTERGFDQDLVTPLVPNRNNPTEGRILRIDEWESFVFHNLPGYLEDDEVKQKEKIGPYSIMLPYNERRDSVHKFYQTRSTAINNDAAEYATSKLSELVTSRLHATDLDTAFNSMPRGTNLGMPVPTADQKYRRVVLELARSIGRGGFRAALDPGLLFWRGQPKGLLEIPKQRNVTGVPHTIILWELTLQRSFLQYIRRDITFAAWVSDDQVNKGVTTALDIAAHGVLSVDYSGFDVSVPGSILRLVFDVVRSWFSSASRPIVDYMERSFLTIPLFTPEGILYDRDGGVPSGQGGTNWIDTLVQIWATHYAAFRMRNEVQFMMAQGDDGVVVFRRPWSVEDFIDAMSELNLDVSDSKGGVSNHIVHYLQNVHSKDYRPNGTCVGVRPAFRILNGMLSYERFKSKWNGADDTFRWMQQLNNGRWHPNFNQMVDWQWEHDDYLKEYTHQQLLKKAGGLKAVESALGQQSFPYGKTPVSKLERSAVGRRLEMLRHRGDHDVGASDFLL